MNAEHYLQFLQNTFSNFMDELCLQKCQHIWLQEDCVSFYNRLAVRVYLYNMFLKKY